MWGREDSTLHLTFFLPLIANLSGCEFGLIEWLWKQFAQLEWEALILIMYHCIIAKIASAFEIQTEYAITASLFLTQQRFGWTNSLFSEQFQSMIELNGAVRNQRSIVNQPTAPMGMTSQLVCLKKTLESNITIEHKDNSQSAKYWYTFWDLYHSVIIYLRAECPASWRWKSLKSSWERVLSSAIFCQLKSKQALDTDT